MTLTPNAGLSVPCSMSPSSTFSSSARCILVKTRARWCTVASGDQIGRITKKRKRQRNKRTLDWPETYNAATNNCPPFPVAEITVRRAAQLFCNRLCSSESFSGLLRKVYVFIYWLAVMCSHGSVTVDPVRGDRRICHMHLSFAMLIEILFSYPKFS